MDRPQRKTTRLPGYDYDTPGYYFITFCVAEKKKLLCDIAVESVIEGATVRFLAYGEIARKQLEKMCDFYGDVKVDKYAIMPNHIHVILRILDDSDIDPEKPLLKCSRIPKFISTFKRFCNKQYGKNIWQYRSHDHVIRDERDYLKIWKYIDNNPAKWTEDCFYVE